MSTGMSRSCGVSVGHNAVLHGEAGFLIGMGAARLLPCFAPRARTGAGRLEACGFW